MMQKYSEAEKEQIRFLLQRRDTLYAENILMSFDWIVAQLKKEFDIKISRSTLCRYSRNINIGQAHKKYNAVNAFAKQIEEALNNQKKKDANKKQKELEIIEEIAPAEEEEQSDE